MCVHEAFCRGQLQGHLSVVVGNVSSHFCEDQLRFDIGSLKRLTHGSMVPYHVGCSYGRQGICSRTGCFRNLHYSQKVLIQNAIKLCVVISGLIGKKWGVRRFVWSFVVTKFFFILKRTRPYRRISFIERSIVESTNYNSRCKSIRL